MKYVTTAAGHVFVAERNGAGSPTVIVQAHPPLLVSDGKAATYVAAGQAEGLAMFLSEGPADPTIDSLDFPDPEEVIQAIINAAYALAISGGAATVDDAVAALIAGAGGLGAATRNALDSRYLGYWPHGLDPTGGTGAAASIAAALNAGERVHLKRGDYLLDQEILLTGQPGGDIVLTADPGTRLIRTHTGRGIFQKPTPATAALGLNAAAANTDHVQVATNPHWTTDQWVGYSVEMAYLDVSSLPAYDPATNYVQGDVVQYLATAYQSLIEGNVGNPPNTSADAWTRFPTQRRKIVGNSADTLYFEWPLGAVVSAGSTATIYQRATNTVMTGWHMLAPNGGQAGVVLNWPGVVDLDLRVDGTTSGNPLSVYHADGGHLNLKAKGGSILGFLYNCENLWATGDIEGIPGITTYHGLQAKDCRDTTLYDVIGKNLARVCDGKASGLSKSHNVSIRGGKARNVSQIAFDLYCLLNEGTVYAAENYSIADVQGIGCQTVVRTYDANTGAGQPRAKNFRIGDFEALDSTGVALVVNAPATQVHDGRIIGTGPYAISLVGADRSKLTGIAVEGANRTSNTEVMRVTDTVDAETHVTVDLKAGDNTRRFVNELGTSNRNKHQWTVRDPAAVATSDAVLLGTSSFSKTAADPAALAKMHAALGMAGDRTYTMERLAASLSNTVTMGTAYITAFTPLVDLTISKLEVMSGSAALTGTPTLIRVGLFTIASNGQATLVARSASDTSLLAAANTIYSKVLDATGGFPTTYALVAGQRYGIALIVVGATAASFKGSSLTAALAQEGIVRGGQLGTGLTDLPTAATAIGNNTLLPWAAAVV